jgi:enamine deaminase RidA (YjgF/YER057c/UK114 family)
MVRSMKLFPMLAAVFALALSPAAFAAEIERQGEGRLFFTTITIPANAETLYVSGSGASQLPDGSWGDTEQQATNTFEKFKATLEDAGWSMSDIVQVRVFGVAGKFDFAAFNQAYLKFFGTEENPQKPVRSVVEVAAMVVDGWVLEIEIRAARVK